MKKTTIFLSGIAIAIAMLFAGAKVFATLVPNLSLINATGGSSSVQITVFGADANSSVLLHYPSTASFTSSNIGTTNASGYLTTTVNSTSYGITAGAMVYVSVNGSQSQQVAWPSFVSSSILALSQNSVTLSAGQSTVVTAAVSAALTMSNNSNPSVASVSLSGNQITVNALAAGASNITICAGNVGCGVIAVNVQQVSTAAAAVSFSQGTVSLSVGQAQSVTISGSGNYYISNISNPAVVTATINGSTLNLNGIIAGTATVGVCTQGSNSSSCSSVMVNVSGTSLTTTSLTNPNLQTLSFSQSQVTLSVGQTQTVSITGGSIGGVYIIQSNSTPGSVSANLNGSIVTLYGAAVGGANVNICVMGTLTCGNVYAYVSTGTTGAGTPAPTVANTTAPALASFSVTSNNSNGSYLGVGNILTVSMTANQAISTPTITISGNALTAVGSGNGPYTATYTLPTNSSALPLYLSFNNVAGLNGQAKFTIGDATTAGLVPNITPNTSGSSQTAVSTPASSATGATQITTSLKIGSKGAQVTLLQKRLKALGFYSGPITGTYGGQTEAAVKALQVKYKLSSLGSVGPATRAILNK